MFDKIFFDQLHDRLERYFDRFTSVERVVLLLRANQEEYVMVEILEYDERFITFTYWPRDKADLPEKWSEVRTGLAALTIPYPDIRSIEFNPGIVRGREIGFRRGE